MVDSSKEKKKRKKRKTTDGRVGSGKGSGKGSGEGSGEGGVSLDEPLSSSDDDDDDVEGEGEGEGGGGLTGPGLVSGGDVLGDEGSVSSGGSHGPGGVLTRKPSQLRRHGYSFRMTINASSEKSLDELGRWVRMGRVSYLISTQLRSFLAQPSLN